MRVVNYIWHGRLANTEFLARFDKTDKNRPKMAVVKLKGVGTLLVFPSLKYRLMGGQCAEAEIQLTGIGIPVITCIIQNITVVDRLAHRVNIK